MAHYLLQFQIQTPLFGTNALHNLASSNSQFALSYFTVFEIIYYLLSTPGLLCNPMDCRCKPSLSMGFSRQEYWSGLLCLSLEDLPDPGFEPASPVAPAL